MKRNRTPILLQPDPSRVVIRPFELHNRERIAKIIGRVFSLSERRARDQAKRLLDEFGGRHTNPRAIFLDRFNQVKEFLLTDMPMTEDRKLLIGGYFLQEYALEAAALFNPSIVPHPDQSGLTQGELRYIMSLRATGEGHISSITFRTGRIDAQGRVTVDPASPLVNSGTVEADPSYDRALFLRKLHELGLDTPWSREIMEELEDSFTLLQLEAVVLRALARNRFSPAIERENADALLSLARANYELDFNPTGDLSERVIFPYSSTETRGIEDARFVRFEEEDGQSIYYATYTAYNGHAFLPQLLATKNFCEFSINTLNGPEVQNKGMALFPRKINGRYAMISRQDNENVYLMYSNMLHFWYEKTLLLRPTFPWEYVQLGNCGSPIETSEGWLLLTHGVGFMRKYAIGAVLLDLDDPSRVIGRLKRPLLAPDAREREGYVPNVVYSCGALVHAGRLILPYALSDQCTSFATFDLEELLTELKQAGNPR
ncbi:glycoside hydrolase family 130 protein [Coraliomargarita sp. SDUM461004]|uniref:Glycoside hydrolase family 130 protein n=1 Tax=Thalassobacterium sedimentorum TaxID=3041258 RepID=A0ABU1AIH9_9BACT|nr:glycoside hydrolase family 130 protein [Coraliomargarita sp. SDUM461004]MDQ8193433.1 glycoside hydrolase family 130 protein [Coraliomargarita sp. SDUM461004]